MMIASPNPNAVRERFDAALEEAEIRFAAVEAARRVHPGGAVEVVRAESAYRRAMLIYQSCELELRTIGALNRSRRHATCKVLLYSHEELIRASLADLLRIRGYKATVTATLAAMRTACKELSHAVAVAYLDPGCSAPLMEGVKRAALPLPVLFVTGALPTVPDPRHPLLQDANTPGHRAVPVHLLCSELERFVWPESVRP